MTDLRRKLITQIVISSPGPLDPEQIRAINALLLPHQVVTPPPSALRAASPPPPLDLDYEHMPTIPLHVYLAQGRESLRTFDFTRHKGQQVHSPIPASRMNDVDYPIAP